MSASYSSGVAPQHDRSGSSSSSESSDSPTNVVDLSQDTEWVDVTPDIEEEHFVSLLDDKVFKNVPEMLEYCKVEKNFDFVKQVQQFGADFGFLYHPLQDSSCDMHAPFCTDILL